MGPCIVPGHSFWTCFNLDWLLYIFGTQHLYHFHYHPGGTFCFSLVLYLLFLVSHNVAFPSLLPHFGEWCLLAALCKRYVQEVNSLRSYHFENIFNLFLFWIGSLSGYCILSWELLFFRILKTLVHHHCCFSKIWRLFLTGRIKYLLISPIVMRKYLF